MDELEGLDIISFTYVLFFHLAESPSIAVEGKRIHGLCQYYHPSILRLPPLG